MISESDRIHITALFKKFGCTPSEVNIYLKCLSIGPKTVQEIAKSLKKNRVTVHSAIQQLIEKGFLYETRKGKRRIIAAEKPEILGNLYQKKANELRLMKRNVGYVESLLQKIERRESSIPSIKFYEGSDGFKKMLEESMESEGEVFVFSYAERLADFVSHEYLENYVRRRAEKNIHTRLIFPRCSFATRINAKSDQYKLKIRYLPDDLNWRAGIFSWNNKIAILSYTEDKPTCTIIENPDITHFFQHIIFEMIWSGAMP